MYRYATVAGTLLEVLRSEGLFRGCFKGFSMNVVKTPVSSGIYFSTLEFVAPKLRRAALGGGDGGHASPQPQQPHRDRT